MPSQLREHNTTNPNKNCTIRPVYNITITITLYIVKLFHTKKKIKSTIILTNSKKYINKNILINNNKKGAGEVQW